MTVVRPGAAPLVADRAAGRENNFNLIRMVAATGVLVSHAWPISLGPDAVQPLSQVLRGTTLGTACVLVFFAVSGFFITRSFDTRRAPAAFLAARALRLFPALAVVLAVTLAVAGALVTTAPAAVFGARAPEYFLRNLTLFLPLYDLPGVFETNPYGPPINGSLWTLSYEVVCYAGVFLAGMLGLLVRRRLFAAAALAFVAFYVAAEVFALHYRLEQLAKLGLPFLIGGCCWVWRDRVPLSFGLAAGLAAAAALAWPTPAFQAVFTLALAYAALVAGFRGPRWLGLYNRLGDYSYGMYVYAFPVQQMIAWQDVTDPLRNIALAVPATLACAVLSWHLVEARALRLRSRRASGRVSSAGPW